MKFPGPPPVGVSPSDPSVAATPHEADSERPAGSVPSGSVRHTGYLVGFWYDQIWLIWTPVWVMLVCGLLSFFDLANLEFSHHNGSGLTTRYVFPTLALAVSMGHVFAVYFRSYLNPTIFPLHRGRFVVVPLLLLFVLLSQSWLVIPFAVFITWFDNWHSAMQTFGLGRLYDQKAGNSAWTGRSLDIGLAIVTFLGPLLAGVTLVDALHNFEDFSELGWNTLAQVPGFVAYHQPWLSGTILIGGAGYIAFYLYSYRQLSHRGYQYPRQKVWLWVALAMTSLLTWGFDSFGQSFVIMETFHALQYFALVWWSEKRNWMRILRVENLFHSENLRRMVSFFLFLGISLFVGAWAALYSDTEVEFAFFLVLEFQHYWYDGFVWSVRRRQV